MTERKHMAKKGKAAVAEAEDDAEDLELEDLDEDVAEDKPSKGKGKAEEVTFGAADLAKLASKVTGKEYNARAIRQLLRKMARDGSGRIEREIVAGNKSRYNWSGPNDPEVKAVLKAIKGGELEEERKKALDKLKSDKAKKKNKAEGKKGKKAKAAEPEELDELEDIDGTDDD